MKTRNSFQGSTGCLLVLSIITLFSWSCSTPRTDPKVLFKAWKDHLKTSYLIQPGDRLRITVASTPEEVVIDPKGMGRLAKIGTLSFLGRSMADMRRELTSRFSKFFSDPQIELTLLEPIEQVVYVGGEVRGRGGAIPYRPGMTLFRAVLATGSFDITAKTSEVILLRQDQSGKPLSYRIDLNKIAYDGGLDVPLLPNDLVFVQTSAAGDVANFVELFIRRMLPINPGGVVGAYVGASAQ